MSHYCETANRPKFIFIPSVTTAKYYFMLNIYFIYICILWLLHLSHSKWISIMQIQCILNVFFCPVCSFYSQFSSLSLKWIFSDSCHQLWLPHHSQGCTVWDRGVLGCQIKGKTLCLGGDGLYPGISAVWTFYFISFGLYLIGKCRQSPWGCPGLTWTFF